MIFITKARTNEQYRLELAELFPNIEHIGEYIASNKKTTYKCKICGNVWDTTPDVLKGSKHGCPVCARQSRMLTNEYFVSKMKELHPNIELLEPYDGLSKKIKSRCLIDGYVWNLTPHHSLYNNRGCPKCAGNIKLTNEDFIQRLKIEHPQLVALSEYQNDSAKVELRCNVCGYEWAAAPTHLHQGKGCPKCAIRKNTQKLAKTKEAFVKEMSDVDPNVIIVGEYRNSKTNIECKCANCGREWAAMPINLLRNKGCPSCAQSKGEHKISTWLKSHKINFHQEYRFGDCRYQRPLPFDFYLPDHNVCIEYDGQQHYFPVSFGGQSQDDAKECFERNKIKDGIKNDYLSLIHI